MNIENMPIINPNIDKPKKINPTHPYERIKKDKPRQENPRKINERDKKEDPEKKEGIDIYA